MPDYSNRRLGRLPATQDARTFRLERYLDVSALPPIPAVINWLLKIVTWAMFLNDKLGCCVISAMAHQEQAASIANGAEVTIVDNDVLTGYEAVGGYKPGHPETDQGCDPLTALKYWQKTGIAGNKIGAYVAVNPANLPLVRAALYLFGGLFVGLDLPLSAQSQSTWDVVGDGKTGNSAPGSWGGHMVFIGAQDAAGNFEDVTWGEVLKITPRFLATYCPNECYAVIPTAWLNDHGLAPNGLDMAALTRDLAIVSGQPDPGPAPWRPDPTVMSWLAWRNSAGAYVAQQYATGNLTGARSEEAVLAQYEPQIVALLQGQATNLPARVPSVTTP